MSKQYKIREFPNINDQRIYIFCFHVQNIATVIHNLLVSIVEENKQVDVSLGIVFSLLHRILECSTSIQLLAIKGRARDIAVLLLNIMELRINLQYMSLDTNRLQEWKNHENSWQKPWKLDNQLKEICKTKRELEAERDMYHLFSMIKHGSPASTHDGFNNSDDDVRITNIAFTISSEPNGMRIDLSKSNYLLSTYIFATGTNLYEACIAGLQVLSSLGLNFPEIEKRLKRSYHELNSFHMKDIKEQNIEWNRQNDDQFRGKWDASEQRGRILKKERDALFKEMEALRYKIEIANDENR
jgi:hypothetical protein